MKKFLALITALLLVLAALPVFAVPETPALRTARTELLDLSELTEAAANEDEGWAFDPAGNDGEPQLQLNNYGSEEAHSAPIKVPANCTVVVTGDCYIDNIVTSPDIEMPALLSAGDGYLRIEGTGTLNLYAEEVHLQNYYPISQPGTAYNGSCICLPLGSVSNDYTEILYINDVTIHCYGRERTSSNTGREPACIFAQVTAEIRNATITTHWGQYGIRCNGQSMTGGANEENGRTLVIENSNIDIQNESANGLWNYAFGIYQDQGMIHIKNSNININAGSKSISATICLRVEGGRLNVRSTATSSADSAAIVFCSRLIVEGELEELYFGAKSPASAKVIAYSTAAYLNHDSELGEGLEVAIGTFDNNRFAGAPDPDNNNLPALKIVPGGEEPPVETHTVSFYGFGDELIEAVEVADGEAAEAPEVPAEIETENGTYIFYEWDADFSEVTEDIEVHAVYLLRGDVDFNGAVDINDALAVLRAAMNIIEFNDEQTLVGDYDGSGTLDINDALYILRKSMNIS